MRVIRDAVRGVPQPMSPGLIVFAVASVVDLTLHAAPFGWGEVLEGYLGHEGYLAHIGIMAGMILTLLGLIAWGAIRPPRRPVALLVPVHRTVRRQRIDRADS